MFARLVARAWRNVPFPPIDPTVAITHLDNDWFECSERLVRENIWLDQGKANLPQCKLMYLSLLAVPAMRRVR
jgi:hypothetical protein